MYLRELTIRHLKRISSLRLAFPGPVPARRGQRAHVPWTVLIGENGTCKTAILQAIAMTAAGGLQVNGLVGRSVGHLVDRRGAALLMEVDARYELPARVILRPERLPGLPPEDQRPGSLQLRSKVALRSNTNTIFGSAWYERDEVAIRPGAPDPLVLARSEQTPAWFVAGYGVSRTLPDAAIRPANLSSLDRLRPLFDGSVSLTSTNFINYFADDRRRTQSFVRALQSVLISPGGSSPLLPELEGLTLSGRGGVTQATDLLERQRFKQRMGREIQGIPAVALAHGYQSTIAWIADLIGHVLLEAEEALPPEQMTGLVLVDEIDLYIHPALQVSLLRGLKRAFPLVQFIVTTHSPLVLAALRPDEDEIVRLVANPETGDVGPINIRGGGEHEPDARVMTTAGIYQYYFGLGRVFGGPEGAERAEYQSIASNPSRSDAEDERMRMLERSLRREGVELTMAPTERITRGGRS
jgi:predicted ATPase